jgi:hypothetical protein
MGQTTNVLLVGKSSDSSWTERILEPSEGNTDTQPTLRRKQMSMYVIQANVSKERDNGAHVNRQVPTFYLHSGVQGITDAEHACNIARSIIDPWAEFTVHVFAQNCDAPDSDSHGKNFG